MVPIRVLDQVLDCGGYCLVGDGTVGWDGDLSHALRAGAARRAVVAATGATIV